MKISAVIDYIFANSALEAVMSPAELPRLLHRGHEKMLVPLVQQAFLQAVSRLARYVADFDYTDKTLTVTVNIAPGISPSAAAKIEPRLMAALAYMVLRQSFIPVDKKAADYFASLADDALSGIVGLLAGRTAPPPPLVPNWG